MLKNFMLNIVALTQNLANVLPLHSYSWQDHICILLLLSSDKAKIKAKVIMGKNICLKQFATHLWKEEAFFSTLQKKLNEVSYIKVVFSK